MTHASPVPLEAAIRGLCPRCGAKTLFRRLATFHDRCRACGLDYQSFNVGDGPAAFLTLLVGALVTALAIALELSLRPPFWVHIILWVPITFAAVLFALRFSKALLLALEYKNGAREGRMAGDE